MSYFFVINKFIPIKNVNPIKLVDIFYNDLFNHAHMMKLNNPDKGAIHGRNNLAEQDHKTSQVKLDTLHSFYIRYLRSLTPLLRDFPFYFPAEQDTLYIPP